MAPEFCGFKFDEIGAHNDIWQIGVIFLSLLMKQSELFAENDVDSYLFRVLSHYSY